jgi:surface polysaccharide O-acyltransferase-like enzyme
MISGALLLNPAHRFRLGKQVLRVLIPLMVWSAVIVTANDVLAHRHDPIISGSSLRDPEDVGHAVKAFFAGPLAYHLWFVYVLIGIYLVVPLLRPLTALPAERRGQLLRYGLVLWFVFSVLYWTAQHAYSGTPRYYPSAIPELPSYYLGLFLLGFYLHHHGIRVRGRELPAGGYFALAAAAAVTTFLLVWLVDTNQASTPWPWHNLTPQIVGYSVGVFLFAKGVMNRPGRCYPFVALFSRLSYRIYLMHVLFLHYFRHFSPLHRWYYDQPIAALAVAIAFTIGCSFLLAWLIDQIKPIRNYV